MSKYPNAVDARKGLSARGGGPNHQGRLHTELQQISRLVSGRLLPLFNQQRRDAQPVRPRLRLDARADAGENDATRGGLVFDPVAAVATTGQVLSLTTASPTPSTTYCGPSAHLRFALPPASRVPLAQPAPTRPVQPTATICQSSSLITTGPIPSLTIPPVVLPPSLLVRSICPAARLSSLSPFLEAQTAAQLMILPVLPQHRSSSGSPCPCSCSNSLLHLSAGSAL
jgi:hypothetical protein